jgi:hypothetical protein
LIRRSVFLVSAAVGFIVVFPSIALAHGIGGRLDLPVPVSFFVGAAAVVLVVSFAVLALTWPEPRFQDGPLHEVSSISIRRSGFSGAVGVVALVLVIGQLVPELFGLETDPTRPTIAPVLVWVVFWLVVPFAGAVIGDWYTDLNPWRTIARTLRIGEAERSHVTASAGVWPAAAGLVAFTWLELIHPSPASPVTLGTAALVYTLALMGGMAVIGRESGLATFDAFTPYNRLISAISPLGRSEDGRLIWRGWLRSLTVIPQWRGLAFFVIVAIGTVSYDGASGTAWFRDTFDDLSRSVPGSTLLFLASVALVGLAYYLASWMAARLGSGSWTAREVASRFAHSLVPIALAYAVAHYLTLILFEGQQLIAAVSDPFALGWNLFGTAEWKIDFFITAAEPIWYAQVGVLVLGHVLGVVLAHDRALTDFGIGAVRSQYAMLVLMVALTTSGLLILSG